MSHPTTTAPQTSTSDRDTWKDQSLDAPAVNLAPTACRKCRVQKLKCTRDIPSCHRCMKQHVPCAYLPPSNRRAGGYKRRNLSRNGPGDDSHVAARRKAVPRGDDSGHNGLASEQRPELNSRPIQTTALAGSDTTFSPLNDLRYQSRSRHSATAECHFVSPPNSQPSDHLPLVENAAAPARDIGKDDAAALPPTMFGLSLLEVYFSHVYQASLLFHKSTLFQDYIDGRAPHHLMRAVFAMATVYLSDAVEGSKTHTSSHLASLRIFYERGLPWAKAAAQEVMPLADQPTLERIQTLECIQLFWFARGDLRRAKIYYFLAYRSCGILGYNKLFNRPMDHPTIAFEHELKRRCFWACWATMCVSAEPKSDADYAWHEAAGLPLPATIIRSRLGLEIKISGKMDLEWNTSPVDEGRVEASSEVPVIVEIIKTLGVWAKIQLYVAQYDEYNATRKRDDLSTLSNLANSMYKPDAFDASLSPDLPQEVRELHLLRYCLCHLCQIVLNSAVVPLFSGRPANLAISQSTVHASAKVVVQNATSLAEAFRKRVEEGKDLITVSPIIAYGAFVTGSVCAVYEKSQRHREVVDDFAAIPKVDSREMAAIREILDRLRQFWQPLGRLAYKLEEAIASCYSANNLRNVTTTNKRRNFPQQPDEASFKARGISTRNVVSLVQTTYIPPSSPSQEDSNNTGASVNNSNWAAPDPEPSPPENVSHQQPSMGEHNSGAMTNLLVTSTSKDRLDTLVYEQAEVQSVAGQFQLNEEVEDSSWWNLLATPSYDMLPVWNDLFYLPTNTDGNINGME